MKRLFQFLLAAALLTAGYFVWIWSHPTPEHAIRKQMEKLAETLVAKPGEGNFARVAAVNKTLSFFTSDIYINTESIAPLYESINGKTELQQALFTVRSRLNGAVAFHDVHMVVGPEETNATVNFTAAAHLADEKDPHTQSLRAQFKKVDGDWLIARVEPIALQPLKEEK